MGWIKCSERLPTKDENHKKIAVIIGSRIFIANVTYMYGAIYDFHSNNINYILEDYDYESTDNEFCLTYKTKGSWTLPSHFKEPTYWCILPELPKGD